GGEGGQNTDSRFLPSICSGTADSRTIHGWCGKTAVLVRGVERAGDCQSADGGERAWPVPAHHPRRRAWSPPTPPSRIVPFPVHPRAPTVVTPLGRPLATNFGDPFNGRGVLGLGSGD